MEDKFIEISRDIADKFIQSIVFIDDKAYENDSTQNAFDASLVSAVFAEKCKVCAVYAPKSMQDIDVYEKIISRADVSIIDWNIALENSKDVDIEADAADDDPRGIFTLSLISRCMQQNTDMLKLVVVYTGETDLDDITDKIFNVLNTDKGGFQKGNCSVCSSNTKIIIRAKRTSPSQFEHKPEWKDKIVDYKDLPNTIVNEFSAMTNGLLPNFAMSAITSIRNNTSRMLSVFSSDMDPAYLGQKVSLEHPDDSKMLLIRLLGEAISELLEASNIDTKDMVDNWIDCHILNGNINFNGETITRTRDILKKMISSHKSDVSEKYESVSDFGGLSNSKKEKVKREMKKNPAKFFEYDDVDIDKSNLNFAILTHYKTLPNPIKNIHNLTLGTIIKQRTGENGSKKYNYFVCIQQRCDSVRIPKDGRKFLFLPLTDDKGDHSIIVDSELKYINKKSFSIKTIKFKPKKNETVIYTELQDNKYVFNSVYGEEFEWVVDLKDLHAQRIVNDYCSQLFRVGLDESEWLRLSAK